MNPDKKASELTVREQFRLSVMQALVGSVGTGLINPEGAPAEKWIGGIVRNGPKIADRILDELAALEALKAKKAQEAA